MSEIHFTLEFNSRNSGPAFHGDKWTQLDRTPVTINYGNNARLFLADSDSKKLCIMGHPIINDSINNKEFSRNYLTADRGGNYFREINGEFLLIEIDKTEHSIRIINSRFASPIFWYVAQKDYFLGSTSYYHLCLRLKELNQFHLKRETFYEFLNFRRVFGESTYDKYSLYLKPAHILTISRNNTNLKSYWQINYEKSAGNLKGNNYVNKFISAIQTSIKRKTSDNKRYGLFLSGGMDTRTVLANFNGNLPHCFTLTYSKNSREYKVAKTLAALKGAEHTWINIKEGHDRKYLDQCVKLTGAMYMTPALFLGHESLLKNYIDVLFSGYGFDYFFQGMYVPSKTYSLLGGRLNYRRMHNIKGDIAEYFIRNISYRTKGASISSLLKKNRISEMNDYLKNILSASISEATEISDNTFNIWEYINFSNLSRHYTYGGQLELMTLAEHRTISYDNDLYDIYLGLPIDQRYDARLMRKVLKKVNPLFYNYISANNGFPVKYSLNQRAFLQIFRSLKRKILLKKNEIENTPSTFKRTWLPIEVVLKNEMPDYIESLKDSDELDSLGIFDMDSLRKNIDKWMENQMVGDQTFLVLLTIARFIKNIEQHSPH